MQHTKFLLLSLAAATIISGCSSMPPNSSLAEAHNSYNSAQTNPEVVNLAPLQLKTAEQALNKADQAFNENESDGMIDHLSYLAKQRISIAEETAKKKVAEFALANALIKRNLARRLATANMTPSQLGMNPQAAELAIAGFNSECKQNHNYEQGK